MVELVCILFLLICAIVYWLLALFEDDSTKSYLLLIMGWLLFISAQLIYGFSDTKQVVEQIKPAAKNISWWF